MTGNGTDEINEHLTLRSQVAELARIPPWVDTLATGYSVQDKTRFAMKLCLEEAISNILRYGYSNEPDHSVNIRLANPRKGYLVFIVEDTAPHFNAVDAPELPTYSLDDDRVGGQGIRLLRRFADTLEYQPMASGNRLSIGFFTAGPARAKD